MYKEKVNLWSHSTFSSPFKFRYLQTSLTLLSQSQSQSLSLSLYLSFLSFYLPLKHKQVFFTIMEPTQPLIPKKITNMVRLILFILQKNVSKKKLMQDLNFMMKRGKILGKSFNDLMIRQHTALGCSSHDVHLSYVSPRDYEFSCSSTPPHHSYIPFHLSKSKNRYLGSHYKRHAPSRPTYRTPPTFDDDMVAASSMKMLRGDDVVVEETLRRQPMKTVSSSVRLRDGDDSFYVDKAAEEFIERFYRELMLQKCMTAREGVVRYG